MKLFLRLSVYFLFLLMSCETTEVEITPQLPILLEIFISDHSGSYDYSSIEIKEVEELIRQDAENFEVWVAGISILNQKSIEQHVLIEGPFHLDTLDVENYSIYQLGDVKDHNRNQVQSFDTKLIVLIQLMKDQLFVKKDQPWSDVNGALQCAERLAQQEQFRNFTIRLIILSDLDQDQEGSHNRDLKTFYFPEQTVIYPIGMNKNLDLKATFPKCRIEPLVQFKSSFFKPN